MPAWRAVEFAWPNVSGRIFPTHRRWPEALEIEGRVWTPSFYMGLLPFVLALGAWSLRKSAASQTRFLSWAVLLSAVASLGVYGWGWFARQFAENFGPGGPNYGDEVGGLYWLMTIVLPGYIYFRYPAKLLVIATLGLAMLAGNGWDAYSRESTGRPRRTLIATLVVSLAALVAAVAWKAVLLEHFAFAVPEPLFGPFDAEGAWKDFAASLVQTTFVATIALSLLALRVGRVSGSGFGGRCSP